MTLSGKRIVITRAPHQSTALTQQIEAEGGIAFSYPCIDIASPDNTAPLDNALQALSTFDWVLFTSSNTVRALQNRISELELDIDWSSMKIGSVGTKTERTLSEIFGVTVDFIPQATTGAGLAEELPVIAGQSVLIPQSSLADSTVADILTKRGASVTQVDAYQTVIGTSGADIPQMIMNNQIDALTFTSSSTVYHFVERIHPVDARHIPAVCIGISTYETAIELGFQHAVYPDEYTIPAMVSLLVKLFEEVTNGNT